MAATLYIFCCTSTLVYVSVVDPGGLRGHGPLSPIFHLLHMKYVPNKTLAPQPQFGTLAPYLNPGSTSDIYTPHHCTYQCKTPESNIYLQFYCHMCICNKYAPQKPNIFKMYELLDVYHWHSMIIFMHIWTCCHQWCCFKRYTQTMVMMMTMTVMMMTTMQPNCIVCI